MNSPCEDRENPEDWADTDDNVYSGEYHDPKLDVVVTFDAHAD